MNKVKNCVLALLGFGLTFIGVELTLRVVATVLPLRFQKYLPEDVKILAQSSKRSELPRAYTAIFGDSYAAGQGDWYYDALRREPFGNPPFHSAHVIHELTSSDVVTFGTPGAESADGIVYRPISYIRMLRSRGFDMELPSRVVIYFYEGNDFRGNLEFLARYWDADEDEYTAAAMTSLFDRIFSAGPRADGLIERLRHTQWLKRSYALKLIWVLWQDTILMLSDSGSDAVPENEPRIGLKAGATVLRPLPRLQAPPLWFDTETTRKSLFVLEQSMQYAMRFFTGSRFLLVYIPSPLVIYDVEATSVAVSPPDGTGALYPVSEIHRMSDTLCDRVALVASRVGTAFLDLRPLLRLRAKSDFLHGPNDWHHFNRGGYETLGSAVAASLHLAVHWPPSCQRIEATAP